MHPLIITSLQQSGSIPSLFAPRTSFNILTVSYTHLLIGTGSYKEDHITRLYVSPDYQGKGYGTFIMDKLEAEIAQEYDTVSLDASLPAGIMYEHRGYKTVKHERWECENGGMLIYEIMEKKVKK